jgi:membrane-associated phospholipid phosphatase
MAMKLSRKRILIVLSLVTLIYIIFQVFIVFHDDMKLSQCFWLEHHTIKELEGEKPGSSEYTALVKGISNHHFWVWRLALIGSIALAFYYRRRERRKYILFRNIVLSSLLLLLLAAGVLTWVLKLSLGKPRPSSGITEYLPWSLSTKYHSFPSGHTTETFSYLFPYIYFVRRYLLSIALVLYGIAMSLTRVILAAHFLSDVLFGMYMTITAGLIICSFVEERFDSRARELMQNG